MARLGIYRSGYWLPHGRKVRHSTSGGDSPGEEYNEEELSEFRRKHAWFMAFAPVEDPQIALAVLVENGGGGSSVAAPVARKVVDAYLGSPVVIR